MKHPRENAMNIPSSVDLRRLRSLATAAAAVVLAHAPLAAAEDIDIFVGGAGGAAAANVLIILDNTSNWSRNDQNWPGGVKQGQAELLAIKAAVGTLDASVNVGFMMFTDNATGREGGYVRYAMRPMSPVNRTALQALLQKVYDDFGTPTEKSASSANYSGVLFDAYKYFGGYTSPAHAHDDVAGSPLGATAFGTAVYATQSNIPTWNVDLAGYTDASLITYSPPVNVTGDPCGGKNYIVFIGNGFPNTDTNPQADLSAFLAGVGGNTAQIPLNTFTTQTATATSALGSSASCYKNNSSGQDACSTASAATCGVSFDSCSCQAPTVAAGCTGGKVKYTVVGSTNTTIVTPTGSTALPANNTIRYPDEWTRFLYLTDVNPAPGQQNVVTYSIDVFNAKQDADQTALLYSMANSAGGKYFAAKNQNQIQAALGEIFAEIQSVNSVFVSASLPVSATNRAQNENKVFMGMFRPDPDARPRWFGNMKQFRIADFNGDLKLADAQGRDAINTVTGFVSACASSFWTADSGQYWSGIPTNPSPASTCPISPYDPFSDAPDGPTAEKGGVAQLLRRGNNPGSAASWALNRNIYTKSFATFNTTNVPEMAAHDVNFIRGVNIDAGGNALTYSFLDPAGASRTTTIRPAVHGDVVHSRPLAVNYGGSTGTVVFYGANDGTFRAISAGVTNSAGTGAELWAYVAPESYARLPRLRQNSPMIAYNFLSAVTLTPPPTPKDYFFDGSSGVYQTANNSAVHIFPTMRRGGRMIYAFDVTNPASPSLLWKVGCPNLGDDSGCSAGMSGIGQTWSTPNVARVIVDGTEKPVVIVGGGYDNCEDGSATGDCSAGKGSVIYVLDAATGAVIRSFNTDGRVPSDVAIVDVDYDGLPDYAYVGTTRGNIYRVGFGRSKTAPLASSAWTSTRVAYTTGAKRKFMYAPALLPGFNRSNGKFYVYLALGTGDREQPLETQYPYATPVLNRFYVYMDDVEVTPIPANNLDDTMKFDDFTSNTACGASVVIPGSDKSGWFMDLNQYGRGEQTVSGAVIVGGLVAFSTNRPIPRTANVCAPLGEARGYWFNLFNGSGAIGSVESSCGGDRSGTFAGGGLPPTPVVADVMVDGKVETVVLGAANKKGGASSSLQAQRGFTLKPQKRTRMYYQQKGNN